ncbi:MAG: NAD(P)(+) transhydrogenase (Re/Si-specific) subunit alpha, partial [Chitinophagales bacterium]|nr:NAD(P)(+) transhydrogenase (Re/Si-specific) subunit alpha [Hyphomicrobiales bacterium]
MAVIGVVSEQAGEARVALSPETVKKFVGLGFQVKVAAGAGAGSHFSDAAFRENGAEIVPSAAAALESADIVLKVGRPTTEELGMMKSGAML